ncbi:MAG TPA: DinB family protein, partial [Parasegetibacter sp.]
MIIQLLKKEFEHEVKSTRRLLEAVAEKDIAYKPSPNSWTMGELAQHIATIYHWYAGVITQDEYDMLSDKLERGDPNNIKDTLALFESNVEKARAALDTLTEEKLTVNWTMKAGEKVIIGPAPRGIVSRSFLFNHIY